MTHPVIKSLTALSVISLGVVLIAQQDPGPPQFVTFPILMHVAGPGLDHGHFVYGGDAAIPSPLAGNS